MNDRKAKPKRTVATATKQRVATAYSEALADVEQQAQGELKPEVRLAEQARVEAIAAADGLSAEGIVRDIGGLKSEIGKLLSELSDKLEAEVTKYGQITRAIAAKEKELQDIYEIQKNASSLAALVEAQEREREAFDTATEEKKEAMETESERLREEWAAEKEQHGAEIKERDVLEQKKRERDKEEYQYTFKRQQQVAREEFEDEKARIERELQRTREEMERNLAAREAAVAQREQELADAKKKMDDFPKQLDAAVGKAAKDAVASAQKEAGSKEELLQKEFAGERNVLNARLAALETLVKEQKQRLDQAAEKLDHAYAQMQDIAVKTVEGKSLAQGIVEQVRKSGQERQ